MNLAKKTGIFKAINEMFRQIKQTTKKTLINKTSTRLLRLQFKSDNITKSKAMKVIAKKYCLIISNNRNLLRPLQKIFCKWNFKC